jgi:hypothetical protein
MQVQSAIDMVTTQSVIESRQEPVPIDHIHHMIIQCLLILTQSNGCRSGLNI